MSTFKGTVKISGPVSPTSPSDVYASHMALYGQGGFRSVKTIEDRDNIPPLRREEGMKVYVIDTDLEYRLKGGIENTNWEEIVYSSAAGTGANDSANRIIIDTLPDLEFFPMSKRFKGLSVFVTETDQEFKLLKGIDNVNWVLINEQIPLSGESTSVVVNPDGTTTTINQNIYNSNTVYENKLGCLNKSLIAETILQTTKKDFANYKNSSGNIIKSAEDTNEFSFNITSNVYWVDDYIFFTASTIIDENKINKLFIKITEDSEENTYSLTDMLVQGNNSKIEVYGNDKKIFGYLNFKTSGPKTITVWEEQNNIKVKNIIKSINIFAQNFAILDNGDNVPADIIETTGYTFPSKNYEVRVPDNAIYTLSLAKINLTTKGIDTNNYSILSNTTKVITEDTTYVIDISSIRTNFIDGSYALVLKGTENNIDIPTYFYGPFVIDLV